MWAARQLFHVSLALEAINWHWSTVLSEQRLQVLMCTMPTYPHRAARRAAAPPHFLSSCFSPQFVVSFSFVLPWAQAVNSVGELLIRRNVISPPFISMRIEPGYIALITSAWAGMLGEVWGWVLGLGCVSYLWGRKCFITLTLYGPVLKKLRSQFTANI